MDRIYGFVVRRPKLILLCIALLTGFFAFHARHIQLDSSIESLLPKDDPEKEYYEEVRLLYGSDEIVVIGLVADSIYTQGALERLERITEKIRAMPEVKGVASLTNAQDAIRTVAEVDTPLIPEIPTTASEWEALRDRVAEHPVYLKNLVSADGRAAAINVTFLESMTDEEFRRRGLDQKIQAILDEEGGPGELYYTGLPRFKVHMIESMQRDLKYFLPLVLLCIVVVMLASFRSLRGVLLPALTSVVGLTWTLGIVVLAGSSLSLGSITLPPLLLVLGTVYSLHVVAEYYELARPGREVNEVVLETLRKTGTPVLITAMTTAVGFASLVVNRIVSIREMGVFSSAGILFAFVLSITLVPAILCLLPLPKRHVETFSPVLTSALKKISRLDMQYRKPIILAGILIAVLAAWHVPSIQVDSNFQSFFREDDPIRQASDAINEHLAGSGAFFVTIDGEEKEIIQKWDTLKRIKELQGYIDSLPGIEKTISFVDYCEILDRGIQAMPPLEEVPQASEPKEQTTFWEDPSQLDGVLQLLFLSSKTISSVVNHPSYSRTNIIVRTSLVRASDVTATTEKILAFAAETFPPELTVRVTGEMILHTRTSGDIVRGQIQSLALAAGVIFVVMSIMFLSVRVGLIAMVPNLFPILVFFGLMGASGSVLSLSTNIIAAIVLGIAVDDTIHLMTRLSSQVRATANREEALLHTFSTVGKPVFYTSVVLFLGFLTLCVSTFVPIREFGLLAAASMIVALAADVILLPAILSTMRIITLWDLLYLRLGRDPHKAIPLFEGLRPLQAKIVTLMGELKTFPKGEAIVRQGQMGNEMYVLLKGSADIYIEAGGETKRIAGLERGDVFGEMGLVRHHERTADVVASEDVEVLAVNERFLSRVKRRYPRIGAQIFFNVARILSDRLEDARKVPPA
jgi:hydrophobe/amphiphile efflux-3 (HAE3) family protein